MPVYEYLCDKCGHEFEREQRITEAPVKTCPACRGRKVRRLISRTAFVLKGGGWYSDLYSSAKPEKAGETGEAAASDAGSAKEGGETGGKGGQAATKSEDKTSGKGKGKGGKDKGAKGKSTKAA